MSSLGDAVHCLAGITDACRTLPNLTVDWVIEAPFAEIPLWHSGIRKTIPINLRRWRKSPWAGHHLRAMRDFWRELRLEQYDQILDAQGLIKSAAVARAARGPVTGLARDSAREPLASRAYQRQIHVPWDLHAVSRIRQLFAEGLGYTPPTTPPDYGITLAPSPPATRQLLLLHGTTWPTKHWPEACWAGLIELALQSGFSIRLPWGNDDERTRAQALAARSGDVTVLPRMSLSELRAEMLRSAAVVTVDSGLGHLAAALEVPVVGLYGPTSALKTGLLGGQTTFNLQSEETCSPCLRSECRHQPAESKRPWSTPCMTRLTPQQVWDRVANQLNDAPIASGVD